MPTASPYPESSRLAAGEPEAFASIYTAYEPDLNHFILRFVKSPELAEDLAQEVFLKIWEQRQQLAALDSFRAYLFIVARNHTLSVLKKASRSQAAIGEIARHALAERKDRNNTDDHILLQEYGNWLHQALDALPPRSREINSVHQDRRSRTSYFLSLAIITAVEKTRLQ